MDSGRRAKRRYTRIEGQERENLARTLRDEYENGASVRQVAAQHGLTPDLTQTLLAEAGTVFRPSVTGKRRTPPSVLVADCPTCSRRTILVEDGDNGPTLVAHRARSRFATTLCPAAPVEPAAIRTARPGDEDWERLHWLYQEPPAPHGPSP